MQRLPAVKTRVLPLTTLAHSPAQLGVKLRASTSEADLRARAQAWASAFEETARKDVEGALKLVVRVDDGIVKDRAIFMRNLMRDLLDARRARRAADSQVRRPC
jgi:hypothetical protein